MNKIEQVKKFELNYPEHHHPHGVEDTEPNDSRIWVCTECPHIFTDAEIRDSEANGWWHDCKMHPCQKGQRCESHLEPYLPAPTLYSEPQVVCPKPCCETWCEHKLPHKRDELCNVPCCDTGEFENGCIPVPSTPASGSDRIYPCNKCGKLRFKDEGGTTFSICDECWEKQYGEKKGETPASDDALEALIISAMTMNGEYKIENVAEHAEQIAKALRHAGYSISTPASDHKGKLGELEEK